MLPLRAMQDLQVIHSSCCRPPFTTGGANPAISAGLQNSLGQQPLSAVTCFFAFLCGRDGPVELFLGNQTQTEDELECAKDFYSLAMK